MTGSARARAMGGPSSDDAAASGKPRLTGLKTTAELTRSEVWRRLRGEGRYAEVEYKAVAETNWLCKHLRGLYVPPIEATLVYSDNAQFDLQIWRQNFIARKRETSLAHY
uniref:Uncharacterized protein n=1 Tax=Oryza glaberrima TaxID=4538 RepID=I1PE53_ORYGL